MSGFEDDSSEDEDTVIVTAEHALSNRNHPNDAGFTDFEDFGGLHHASRPDFGQTNNLGQNASRTLSLVDVSLSDDSPNSIDYDEADLDHVQHKENAPWKAFGEFESPKATSDVSNFGKTLSTSTSIPRFIHKSKIKVKKDCGSL